jgi:hypothetical protein
MSVAATYGPFFAKQGVTHRFYFTLAYYDAVGNFSRLHNDAVAAMPIVAGDIKISIDGSAVANATNLPVQVTAVQPMYYIDLTAAEMLAERIHLMFVDQTATPVFPDTTFIINTVLRVGQLAIDAGAVVAANADAVTLTSKGVGLPLNLVPGTARHTNLFDTAMGSEPTAITAAVGSTRSVGLFIQDLWYRFFRKHKKTGSGSSGQLFVYKEDGTTLISTQTASKTGTDQTIDKAS